MNLVAASLPPSQLFEQLSSSDGLLVLQVFGPLTVFLSVLGVCAATLDLKLLLLLVRHTHPPVKTIPTHPPGRGRG